MFIYLTMDNYLQSETKQSDNVDLFFPRFLRTTFSLSKNLQKKLTVNMIRLKSEIDLLNNEELVERFGFISQEINEVNNKIRLQPTLAEYSFSEWQQQTNYIGSGCKGLDIAFGGSGLPTGTLTQLSGEAGTGKSQICMKLCFAVQLATEKGGLDGEALYFDTEDAFRPERICQIATNYFSKDTTEQSLLDFKAKEVLTRIHVRKINTNADDLCNIILNGDIAYHFRYDNEDHNDVRVQQLIRVASKLKQLAYDRNIAIIITNQVKFINAPTLGPLWNSMCQTSLLLKRIDNDINIESEGIHKDNTNDKNSAIQLKLSQRQCFVLKSPNVSNEFNSHYCITANGIEDLIDLNKLNEN